MRETVTGGLGISPFQADMSKATCGGLCAEGGGLCAKGGGLCAQGGEGCATCGGVCATCGEGCAEGGGVCARGGGGCAQSSILNLLTAQKNLHKVESISSRCICY
ncbi:MAG: hypothetical protein LBK00_08320 [Treponema sp.]|nr:hypothetical protein [Treponema sp.]